VDIDYFSSITLSLTKLHFLQVSVATCLTAVREIQG